MPQGGYPIPPAELVVGPFGGEFWKGIIGYEVIAGEGKCFWTTWKNVRELLNQDIPVILFGLDIKE